MAKLVAQGSITLTSIYETLQVKLTNEVVAIPCNSSGAPAADAYAGASTTIEVFMGTTKLEANKISITSRTNYPTTVVSTQTGNVIKITSVPTGTSVVQGYVDIGVSATLADGTKNLGVYRFNFVKQLQGTTGPQGVPGTNGSNGQTLYTWIKYADNAQGGGISNDPTGKTYIGLAHNKTTATESNTASDYTWSLIKGTDGKPGANGSNGITYYTWVRYSANADGSGMTATPQSNTLYIGIAVNRTSSTPSSVITDYVWSRFKGEQGPPGTNGSNGTNGYGYTLEIIGGTRGVAYAANGTTPDPATATAFSVELLKNGTKITPASYSWTSGGNLSGTSTAATFTPSIKTSYASGASFVSVTVKETSSSQAITQTVPIVCTKHADGLDWINDWNNNTVTMGSNKIISPRIFAGTKNSSNQLTGVALGRDVLGGNSNNIIGLVGYKNNKTIFSLDQNANFFVSSSGNAGDVQSGAAKGLYFNGSDFFITGKVKIQSGSTIGSSNTSVDTVVTGASNGTTANQKIDNLKVGSRNLILDSYPEISSTDYLIKRFTTSVPIENAKKYTVVINGKTTGGQKIGVWLNNSASNVGYFPANQDGVAYITITGINITDEAAKKIISFYNYPRAGAATNAAIIRWVAMYEGEIKPPLDWTAAPEDIEKALATIENTANNANDIAVGAGQKAEQVTNKVNDFTLEVDGNTRIKGDLLVEGSIEGTAIKAGSFTIQNKKKNRDTFVINSDGDVKINGTFESDAFDEERNLGYKITPEGNAIFNQAKIRGELELPNAGITNYGATIGNENLVLKSNVAESYAKDNAITISTSEPDYIKITKNTTSTTNALGVWKDIEVKPSREYTISITCGDRSGGKIGIGSHISGNSLWSQYGGYKNLTPNTRTVKTITTLATETKIRIFIAIDNAQPNLAYIEFKDLKAESGSVATPWCPAPSEQSDYVRIWAGESRIKRDIAPFRVTQKGDLFASNATISGRLVGNYDNGLIHMHENEIVINNAQTFMNPYGDIVTMESRGHSAGAHVVLNPTWSILNNNIIFGSEGNRRLEFLNNEDRLKLNMGKIDINNSQKGSMSLSVAHNQGIYLIASQGASGGRHQIKYHDGYGGLIFESSGSNAAGSEDAYDFKFERTNGKANVKVQGNLNLTDSMRSSNHDIEMRCVANEGWGFYAN